MHMKVSPIIWKLDLSCKTLILWWPQAQSGIATSYASARARSDMRICIWCGRGSNSLKLDMHDGDQWQCPGDCPQKASTNH